MAPVLWVLWVQLTFTSACLPDVRCPRPFTTKSQVRTYATEEACRHDIATTRQDVENVGAYLDDLKAELGETPRPDRLLPGQRTYTLWCAPEEQRKRKG